MLLWEISTKAPIKLSIAATSKRADIAAIVGAAFFKTANLPHRSQLHIAMGWRDSELGGTGPAVLIDRKKIDFGFGNPAGLAAMAYNGRGFYQKKIPLRAIGVSASNVTGSVKPTDTCKRRPLGDEVTSTNAVRSGSSFPHPSGARSPSRTRTARTRCPPGTAQHRPAGPRPL